MRETKKTSDCWRPARSSSFWRAGTRRSSPDLRIVSGLERDRHDLEQIGECHPKELDPRDRARLGTVVEPGGDAVDEERVRLVDPIVRVVFVAGRGAALRDHRLEGPSVGVCRPDLEHLVAGSLERVVLHELA